MISKNQIKLIRSLEQKKNRKREQLFVAEGPKVVGDLLRGGYCAHSLFSTDDSLLADLAAMQAPRQNTAARQDSRLNSAMRQDTAARQGQRSAASSIELQRVTDDELRRISFLQHPQQVLALMAIPQYESQPYPADNQLSLALDGVQDPGNMGTIVRIADWFGIDAIYCSADTADVYNPKVVQATMGSLAHVRVVYGDLTEIIRHSHCPVYGTLLDGKNLYEQELTPQGIIVMGNEGNGISPAVRQQVTHRLLIPNYHRGQQTAESLNVAIATAITCAEFRRR